MKQPKIVVGALAGAITVIAVWALREFADIEVTTEVAQSATVVISAIVSVITPDGMEG